MIAGKHCYRQNRKPMTAVRSSNQQHKRQQNHCQEQFGQGRFRHPNHNGRGCTDRTGEELRAAFPLHLPTDKRHQKNHANPDDCFQVYHMGNAKQLSKQCQHRCIRWNAVIDAGNRTDVPVIHRVRIFLRDNVITHQIIPDGIRKFRLVGTR